MKVKCLKNNWSKKSTRDWVIIVITFALVLISLSIFAWKIYLSDKLAGGYLEPTIEPMDISTQIIDNEKLQANLLILKAKQDDYQKLKTSNYKLIDPSL